MNWTVRWSALLCLRPHMAEALSDAFVWRLSDLCLYDVCLSVTYIWPNSRTERPRKTKIGTEVAHVTRDSNTTFKVKGADVLNSQHAGAGATWRIDMKILLWWNSTATCWIIAKLLSTCRGHRHIVLPCAHLVIHILFPITDNDQCKQVQTVTLLLSYSTTTVVLPKR